MRRVPISNTINELQRLLEPAKGEETCVGLTVENLPRISKPEPDVSRYIQVDAFKLILEYAIIGDAYVKYQAANNHQHDCLRALKKLEDKNKTVDPK